VARHRPPARTTLKKQRKGGRSHSVGAISVDVRDVDLDRAVILGLDQAVGRRALARDVEIDGLALGVLHTQRGSQHASIRGRL
jgi:hypothetical protein